MKSLIALVGVLAVGAAEARITVYRNQDVLAKTLASPVLARALSGNGSIGSDTLQLDSANLVEATIDSASGNGGNASFDQKLMYEVKAQSGRTYQCTIAASSTVTIKTSGGITFSELSEPRTGTLRCR